MLSLYDPFVAMRFGTDTCFLCGAPTNQTDTVPVFPRWLQQAYGLADKQLLLLDKSITTYRDLTIPCCPLCREKYLNPWRRK